MVAGEFAEGVSLEQFEDYRTLAEFIRGRRSLMVASTR